MLPQVLLTSHCVSAASHCCNFSASIFSSEITTGRCKVFE